VLGRDGVLVREEECEKRRIDGLGGGVGDGGCDPLHFHRGGDPRADPGEVGHLQQPALHVFHELDVLDGDGGLGGKGDEDLSLCGAERLGLAAQQNERAKGIASD
jgi:hypothetical protein